MNKNKPEPQAADDPKKDYLFLEDVNQVASATECTGLQPTPPASVDEAEAYTGIYPIPPVTTPTNSGLQHEQGVNAVQTPKF